MAGSRLLSTATFVEASIVADARFDPEGLRNLDRVIERASIELVPVDIEQVRIAREAFGRFGKGRHGAGLNFGDCFSYALARVLGEALLFKGENFSRTGVRGWVLPPQP